MEVLPTRPNLNTSVLKWKRVSGIRAGQPMVFSRAQSERNLEDCAGRTCCMLIGHRLKLIADGRVGTQYCADISWGDPESNRA
jgi:hypothetical protein